jgi:N-methylhydantoinase B
MTLDPVTLAVIQNGLRQVASEMDLVHEKTSFSPVISEGFDRSNGIYDRTTGEVVAQGELGLPIFVGVMQFTTQAVIQRRRDLEPGDVILVNDPYLGGTHLMDVKMVRPFYYRGRLWCYLSNTGHWPDTGGMVPGGFSATATEIVQEGLRLPPVKLVRRGEICQDIIDIVLNNIRVADERIGDIRAQLGALSVGERRLTQLLDRYGVETVDAAIAELKAGVRAADACPYRQHSGRDLFGDRYRRQRRDRRSAARSGARDDGLRLRHPFRPVAVEPAVPWADEFGMGDDAIGSLCRDEAHFS